MGKYNAKSTMGSASVVVGDNKKSAVVTEGKGARNFGGGRKLLKGSIVVIVLLAISVPGYVYVSNKVSKPSKDATVQPAPESGVSKEIAKAEQKLSAAATAKERAAAYADLSNLYINVKNGNDKAVEYARNGVDQEESIESYAQLAFTLEKSGDYKGAAEAYGKAAELAKKAGEVDDGRSGYSYYLKQQKELEAR